MVLEILKFADTPKTQKSEYLENEISHMFFKYKKYSLYVKAYNRAKSIFLVEVTFKDWDIQRRLQSPAKQLRWSF